MLASIIAKFLSPRSFPDLFQINTLWIRNYESPTAANLYIEGKFFIEEVAGKCIILPDLRPPVLRDEQRLNERALVEGVHRVGHRDAGGVGAESWQVPELSLYGWDSCP